MPDSTYSIDLQDIRFVLYDHLHFEQLAALKRYAHLDREQVELVLDEANKFHRDVIAPLNGPGDRQGCRFEAGQVKLPDGFKAAYDKFVENSWPMMTVPQEEGGMELPYTLAQAIGEMTTGGCCSFALSVGLTHAAAGLLAARGSDALKAKYLEPLRTAIWQGTMCLTEPQAGSAVGDARTVATPDGDAWLIEGSKIFITSGEHDATPNHIHFVLARTPNAPAGIKGISLFLVPKYLVNDDGSIGEFNNVVCASIEHKMGIKASPTCTLNFGEGGPSRGWLVGEENGGIKAMFHMMNHARLGVGLQGLALSAQAYNYALAYAEERVQGTAVEQIKDANAPRVPITDHPDVRRMLLWCKAMVEGSRALLYRATFYEDIAESESADEKERQKAQMLLDILTPICKAYISDRGFQVAENAMQILGGYGYIAEYPVEQILRDVKIASIYEGTNGIQALDLLGRKLGSKGGALFQTLMGEMMTFAGTHAEHPQLKTEVGVLSQELQRMQEITMELASMGFSGQQRLAVLSAVPYLKLAGNAVVAWLLLEQGTIADKKLQALYAKANVGDDAAAKAKLHKDNAEARFYYNKLLTARFFVHNVLSENAGVAMQIKSHDRSALDYLI